MIKKIVILMIGLVFLMSTANAEPLVMNTGCDVVAPDGITSEYITTFYAIGDKVSREVIKTDNKVTITCKGTLPSYITKPDRALYFDYANTGYLYQTDQYEINDGLTEDWKQVITPSGNFIIKATVDLKLKNDN